MNNTHLGIERPGFCPHHPTEPSLKEQTDELTKLILALSLSGSHKGRLVGELARLTGTSDAAQRLMVHRDLQRTITALEYEYQLTHQEGASISAALAGLSRHLDKAPAIHT